MRVKYLVSNGPPLRWWMVGREDSLSGVPGWVAGTGWSGRQSDLFGAVVAVASVVPVSPLVSMARRVSTVNRGLLP
jgi:hypothetical protein